MALLFRTDIRTGYADAAALGAAIAAGTHPIFGVSSVFDENFATFDDAVTYLGAGTVKITAGAWLDVVLASPATDFWVRVIQRYSPTFNTNPQADANDGAFHETTLWDSTNYSDFITHFGNTADGTVFQDFARVVGPPVETERTYTLAQLRDGTYRDVVVHFTRSGLNATIRSWLNGVPGTLISQTAGSLLPLSLLEVFWTGNKGAAHYDNTNDYVNVALLEAYSGGNPYGLVPQSGVGGCPRIPVLNG